MLAATIIIMGVGTFGIAAPLLLVCLRLLQGIGLGGEWGGAALMVVENAAIRSRGLLGSMVQIGFPIGVLAAVGMFSLVSKLSEQELMSWGWRVPFLISILLVGVGMSSAVPRFMFPSSDSALSPCRALLVKGAT